ncbi:MAG: hypothetical protein IT192_08000 [Microbacteriaceae bacterium]|nr:hypothetical protein [Microbacteriaceae bacterium]
MTNTHNASGKRSLGFPFWVSWYLLVFLFAAFAVNHLAGIWYIAKSTDEAQMFELFAALHLLAVAVLVVPYRHLQRWAWWSLWIAIVPVGLTFAFAQSPIGVTYLIVAGVMSLAQLVTLPRFTRST